MRAPIDCETHDVAVMEATRLAKRVAELEAALRLCMVGGNHLPLIFGVDHPHAGLPAEVARKHFGPGDKYEAWCCWDAIMRARDVLENT